MKQKKPFGEMGLVGRCFHIFDKGRWRYQGIVRGKLDDQRYLVQFFDAMMGELSTMAIYSIEEMTASSKGGIREGIGWQFYEDDEHMRFWAEHIYNDPKDEE